MRSSRSAIGPTWSISLRDFFSTVISMMFNVVVPLCHAGRSTPWLEVAKVEGASFRKRFDMQEKEKNVVF